MKAFKVNVVDTTAAGDAFLGALATCLSENKPIQEALKFANGAGALATTKLGAQPSLPSRRELEAFLACSKEKTQHYVLPALRSRSIKDLKTELT